MADDEARFKELRTHFGSEDDADQLTLEEFAALFDEDASTLADRLGSDKIAGELLRIRERVRQASPASQQSGGGGWIAQLQTTLSDLVHKLDNLSQTTVALAHKVADIDRVLKTRHEVTPALGSDLLAAIKRNEREIEFTKEGESVLTEDEFHSLRHITDEHELIVALTRRFEVLFDGFAVVNSEAFPWLFTGLGHARQKPDLFVCPVSFYQQRNPNTSDTKQYPAQYRYGVVDDVRLYDGVVLLDCSVSCTPQEFGELSSHLSHLGVRQKGPARGMLFSLREFWLYEQERGVPLSFTRGQWTDAGSKEAIRSFFEKTLAYFRHIDRLCDDLKVRVFDPKSDGGASGFLGQGGFGRVIRVLPKEGGSTRPSGCDVLALKFGQIPEEANNDSELRAEYRGLREHSQDCTCSLVARPTSDFAATSGLCGFVMLPVGATCTRELVFERKTPSLTEVLMALNALHGHSPPILHGDPHLPNLIIIGERLTWIDLRQSAQSTLIDATEFAGDMHKLIVSLFPALKDHVDETVNTLIDSYGEHRNEESIQALVSYLGATRRS